MGLLIIVPVYCVQWKALSNRLTSFCHSLHVRHKPAGFTTNFASTNTIQQPFVNKTYLSSDTQSVKFPVLHASNTVLILKFFTNFLKFCKGLRLLVFDPKNYTVRLEAYIFLRFFRYHIYVISAVVLIVIK